MRSVFYPHLVNGPFGDPALYVRHAHRGEALLFDCGDLHRLGTREILKIGAVFISHAHIDHLAGFDHLLRLMLYREKPLLLCGPPGIAERMAGRLSGYTWNLVEGYPFVLTVREWGEESAREVTFRAQNGFRPESQRNLPCPGGLLQETPWYRVRGVPLEHGDIVSMAYALEEPVHVAIHKDALMSRGYLPGRWLTDFKDLLRQDSANPAKVTVPLAGGDTATFAAGELAGQIAHLERGMKVCYVTDASPSEENAARIAELAADSHLLAIEATFPHSELQRARQRNHLTAQLAGELARQAGAARLLVFHHSPRYHDRPDLLRVEAERAFAAIV